MPGARSQRRRQRHRDRELQPETDLRRRDQRHQPRRPHLRHYGELGGRHAPVARSVPTLKYNIYRGTVPDFVPSAGNRIASCVPGHLLCRHRRPDQRQHLLLCGARRGQQHGQQRRLRRERRIQQRAYSPAPPTVPGTQATPGTWTDGGGDVTSFLRLNTSGPGNTTEPAWRIVRNADDPGANHTPGGAFAYRNAGPGPNAIYSASSVCGSRNAGPDRRLDHTQSDVLGTSPVRERLGRRRDRIFAQWRCVDRCPRAEQLPQLDAWLPIS